MMLEFSKNKQKILELQNKIVDIVLCIEINAGMQQIIESLYNNAPDFYNDISNTVKEIKNNTISSLRMRVIPFRDELSKTINTAQNSDFIKLPDQQNNFAATLKNLYIDNNPFYLNGTDAIARGIKSSWNTPFAANKRQIIIVLTNCKSHTYLNTSAQDFEKLRLCWSDPNLIDQRKKRLILFAPDAPYWQKISYSFDNTVQHTSIYDYNDVIHAIASAITGFMYWD